MYLWRSSKCLLFSVCGVPEGWLSALSAKVFTHETFRLTVSTRNLCIVSISSNWLVMACRGWSFNSASVLSWDLIHARVNVAPHVVGWAAIGAAISSRRCDCLVYSTWRLIDDQLEIAPVVFTRVNFAENVCYFLIRREKGLSERSAREIYVFVGIILDCELDGNTNHAFRFWFDLYRKQTIGRSGVGLEFTHAHINRFICLFTVCRSLTLYLSSLECFVANLGIVWWISPKFAWCAQIELSSRIAVHVVDFYLIQRNLARIIFLYEQLTLVSSAWTHQIRGWIVINHRPFVCINAIFFMSDKLAIFDSLRRFLASCKFGHFTLKDLSKSKNSFNCFPSQFDVRRLLSVISLSFQSLIELLRIWEEPICVSCVLDGRGRHSDYILAYVVI